MSINKKGAIQVPEVILAEEKLKVVFSKFDTAVLMNFKEHYEGLSKILSKFMNVKCSISIFEEAIGTCLIHNKIEEIPKTLLLEKGRAIPLLTITDACPENHELIIYPSSLKETQKNYSYETIIATSEKILSKGEMKEIQKLLSPTAAPPSIRTNDIKELKGLKVKTKLKFSLTVDLILPSQRRAIPTEVIDTYNTMGQGQVPFVFSYALKKLENKEVYYFIQPEEEKEELKEILYINSYIIPSPFTRGKRIRVWIITLKEKDFGKATEEFEKFLDDYYKGVRGVIEKELKKEGELERLSMPKKKFDRTDPFYKFISNCIKKFIDQALK